MHIWLFFSDGTRDQMQLYSCELRFDSGKGKLDSCLWKIMSTWQNKTILKTKRHLNQDCKSVLNNHYSLMPSTGQALLINLSILSKWDSGSELFSKQGPRQWLLPWTNCVFGLNLALWLTSGLLFPENTLGFLPSSELQGPQSDCSSPMVEAQLPKCPASSYSFFYFSI